jgi:hypothetical protein
VHAGKLAYFIRAVLRLDLVNKRGNCLPLSGGVKRAVFDYVQRGLAQKEIIHFMSFARVLGRAKNDQQFPVPYDLCLLSSQLKSCTPYINDSNKGSILRTGILVLLCRGGVKTANGL